jgi:hypothetical protein
MDGGYRHLKTGTAKGEASLLLADRGLRYTLLFFNFDVRRINMSKERW